MSSSGASFRPPSTAAGGTSPVGPVRPADRAPTPDLSRGLALLGIALANSVVQLWGQPLGPGSRPVHASTLDHAVDVVLTLLVDNRAICLFSLLFGYGMAVILRRQDAAGVRHSDTLLLLTRRNLGLIALGFLQAWLLFEGDILATYGMLGFVLLLVLRIPDRALLVLAGLVSLALAWLDSNDGATTTAAGSADVAALASSVADPAAAMLTRLWDWGLQLLFTPIFAIGLVAPMLIGIVLARRRVLERPAEHRELLTRLAVVGIPVSVVGAIPFAIAVGTGGTVLGAHAAWWAALQGWTGLLGGIGYVAAIALWVVRGTDGDLRRGRPRGTIGRAIAATGERSASAYLTQALLLVPILAPWGVGLGGRIGSTEVAVLAIAVWALTVVGCAVLSAFDARGPAEVFLRRVTYGRRTSTDGRGRVTQRATE